MATKRKPAPRCGVDGCNEAPVVEVLLYDVYMYSGKLYDVFYEQDFTCPYLCLKHLSENEAGARKGRVTAGDLREYRDGPSYPHTNRHDSQGFSVYRPLDGSSL